MNFELPHYSGQSLRFIIMDSPFSVFCVGVWYLRVECDCKTVSAEILVSAVHAKKSY